MDDHKKYAEKMFDRQAGQMTHFLGGAQQNHKKNQRDMLKACQD